MLKTINYSLITKKTDLTFEGSPTHVWEKAWLSNNLNATISGRDEDDAICEITFASI